MYLARNKLPDSPWHIGYTKKKEDDPRRHKARCFYYDNSTGICASGDSRYRGIRCGGSAHCEAYRETPPNPKHNHETETVIKGVYAIHKQKKTEVLMDDIITIKNNQTGKETRFRMIPGLGRNTPEITKLCLGKKIGYQFMYQGDSYEIVKISTV